MLVYRVNVTDILQLLIMLVVVTCGINQARVRILMAGSAWMKRSVRAEL